MGLDNFKLPEDSIKLPENSNKETEYKDYASFIEEVIKNKESLEKEALKINSVSSTNDLSLDLSGEVNPIISTKIDKAISSNGKKLNGESIEVPIDDITSYIENEKSIKNKESEDISLQNGKTLKKVGDHITTYFKMSGSYTKSHMENKNTLLPTDLSYTKPYVKGDEKGIATYSNVSFYGKNKIDLKDVEFQGTYMKSVENIVENSDGTLDGFIDGLNDAGLSESDLIQTLSALSAEAYIRTYDNYFEDNPSTEETERILNMGANGDELITNLKESISTGKHINTLTCIQYSTIIAQVLSKQGYETVTGTIDIGVQHRFTALKGEDGLTHIISDGSIFSGNNYKQAYSNYQSLLSTISFRSDLFDVNNDKQGSFQTDTMKDLSNIISANNSNNSQGLLKKVSDEGIDTKNSLLLEIGNNNNVLEYISFDEEGTGFNIGLNNKINKNEGTDIKAIEIGLSQLFDLGDNGNGKISVQGSGAQVEFGNGNSVDTFGLSIEGSAYKGFNTDVNGKVISNGIFGNVAGTVGINSLSLLRDGQVPITNLDITGSIGGTLGYKGSDGSVYIKGGMSGEVHTADDTGKGSLVGGTNSLGNYLSVGGEYIDDNGMVIIAEATKSEYRGEKEKGVNVSFGNNDLLAGLEYNEKDHNAQVIDSEKMYGGSLNYRVGKVGVFEDFIVGGKIIREDIGSQRNTTKGSVELKFTF